MRRFFRIFVVMCALVAGASMVEAQDKRAGGIFYPGVTITSPKIRKEVKPKYTREAQAAGIEGTVWLEAVVLPDGKVGNVRVTRSLDSQYGLDEEAVKTVKKWRFKPGMKDGKPVPVLVEIEMTFSLKKK